VPSMLIEIIGINIKKLLVTQYESNKAHKITDWRFKII
jgi:hypothetical protein